MNAFAITLDIDWAPDFVIDFVAELLIQHNARATWFVTHISPAVERLRQHTQLFELGIHPNFMAGSTHGQTPEAVLDHCMGLVPDAVSMRTHALFQSTPILAKAARLTSIKTDVSLFLPYAVHLQPVRMWFDPEHSLIRVPVYWSDGTEINRPLPGWKTTSLITSADDVKVFAFHPMHVYLNSPNAQPYQKAKERSSRINVLQPADLETLIYSGEGDRTFFLKLIQNLSRKTLLMRIKDIADCWQQFEEREI
jgi:hypothetical protein